MAMPGPAEELPCCLACDAAARQSLQAPIGSDASDAVAAVGPPPPMATVPRSEAPLSAKLLAGSLSTCAAATFSNPFDVVRARRQGAMAANGSATAAAIYAHPLRAIRYMLATRGVADLYSGMPAAYAHNILLNGIRIGMFDAAREGLSSLAPGALGGPTGLACSLLAGFGTGIAGALVASPFTLVKNRQQAWIPTQTHAVSSRYPVYLPASSGTPHYSFSAQFYHTAPASHVLHLAPQAAASTAPPRSVLVNLSQILARQGAAGLYTGARISALRMGLGSAMQLAFYDAAKRSIASTSEAPGVATTFVAAVASGVTTSFIMTPLDLVLTRVQSAGRSTLSVLRHTLAKEGLTGFWKGGAATLLRSTTQTVITFLVYENLRDALGGISGARDSEGDGGRWRGFAFEE